MATLSTKKAKLIEMFGPVIQGEGAMVGVSTFFLRTGGCDFRCDWCDTKYAIEPEQWQPMVKTYNYVDVLHYMRMSNPGTQWVTLSGGNPLLHDLSGLISYLKGYGYRIAVETQGSVYRPWVRDCETITLSPKPPSSKMSFPDLSFDNFIKKSMAVDNPSHRPRVASTIPIKVVVFDEDDYNFATHIHQMYPEHPFYIQPGTPTQGLWIDGSGNDYETSAVRDTILQTTKWLFEKVSQDGLMGSVRVIPQLHTLVYGHRRGV